MGRRESTLVGWTQLDRLDRLVNVGVHPQQRPHLPHVVRSIDAEWLAARDRSLHGWVHDLWC
jgi:hypothetical protein